METPDTPAVPNSPQMAGCQQEPCSGSSLLDWLDDHACELVAESYPISDTGDYDGAWVVYDEPSPVKAINRSSKPRQPMGWGRTPAEAIRDAMKGPDDPTKYDYVPPEYRQNAEIMDAAPPASDLAHDAPAAFHAASGSHSVPKVRLTR